MQIVLYKDLSDAKSIITVEAGKAIKDVIPYDDWIHYAIIVNGQFSTCEHILKETDLVAIRAVPGFLSLLFGIGLGVSLLLGVGVGIYAGVQNYKQQKELKKIQKELESMSSTTSDDVVNLPYLKGASNSVATGKTQPYIIGTHLFTPYILNAGGTSSKGYSDISGNYGEDQYYNLVLEGGFNKQVISKLYCDDVTLKEFADTTPQEGIYYFGSNSPFYDTGSLIEIAQDGNAFATSAFNKKVVEQQVSDQLLKYDNENYEKLYYTLEQNAMSANLCIEFTQGLCHYTSSGTKGSKTRNVIPKYSYDYAQLVAQGDSNPDANATWHTFAFTKRVLHSGETASQTGVFTYTFTATAIDQEKLDYSDIKTKALNNKTDWTFSSGTDVRDTMTDYSMTYTQTVTESSDYKHGEHTKYKLTVAVTINATYTYVIPDYWSDEQTATSFTSSTSLQMRYNAHADFDYDSVKDLSYPITISLETLDTSDDKEPSEGTDYDDIYVQWVQSITYDEKKSAAAGSFVAEKIIEDREAKLSTLIGLRIKATTANEDKLSSIQVITSGVAPTWDGSSWSITESDGTYTVTRSITSNPASWLLEVLTSDAHTPSQLTYDEIDLDSFGELYDYCDSYQNADGNNQKINVNYVITQGMTKSSLLELLCNVCHATLYQNIYGKLSVAIDTYKDNAVAVLNEQNLMSFEWTKDIKREPDGVKLTYTDASTDYTEQQVVVMYDGSDAEERSANSVISSISCDGITSYQQAYLYALYTMKCDRLRPYTAKAVVGKEGIYFTPLDKVLVQHPSLKIGLGNAEIKAVILDDDGLISGLELYDALDLDLTNDFNVIIQCTGSNYNTPKSFAIKGFYGRTKTITFETPFYPSDSVIPHAGDILSYGYEVETITTPMLITGIEPSDTGFALTLVEYNEDIYDASSDIPDYKPNITQPHIGVKQSYNGQTVTPDQMATVVSEAVSGIQKDFAGTPQIYAEISSFGLYVNETGCTTCKQQIKTKVHVQQSNEELDVFFDDDAWDLPDGIHASYSDGTVTFTIDAGTQITAQTIYIPVKYRAFIYNYEYIDEDEVLYADESGNIYGYRTYADNYTEYSLGIGLVPCNGSRYLGAFENITDLDNITPKLIGDYFTYTGTSIESELSQSGKFLQCGIYTYLGENEGVSYVWATDDSTAHTSASLSDILSVAEADLENNNSLAYEYLDHLTANSIFADLIVANKLFVGYATIDELEANYVKISTLTTDYLSADYITSNYTKTSDINTLIKSLGYTDDTNVNLLNAALSASSDKTVIAGGLIKTSLIDVDDLFAQSVTLKDNGLIQSSDFSGGSSGFQIKADGSATFRNGTFTGTINATSGNFSGTLTISDNGLIKSDVQTSSAGFKFDTSGLAYFRSIYAKSIQAWNSLCIYSATLDNPLQTGLYAIGEGVDLRCQNFDCGALQTLMTGGSSRTSCYIKCSGVIKYIDEDDETTLYSIFNGYLTSYETFDMTFYTYKNNSTHTIRITKTGNYNYYYLDDTLVNTGEWSCDIFFF